MAKRSDQTILSVQSLRVHFPTPDGLVKAVDGVSFELNSGETLAIVGESGCGKSVTVLTVMGLVKSPPAIIDGSVRYRGTELLGTGAVAEVRGKKITMIFQEPMSSFDPLYTIGYQLTEVAKKHLGLQAKDARRLGVEMLKKVHIPDAERRFDEYPHQMSGGMLQRVMIAISLMTNPEILIADEPTTALDVTIQAQVLNLINELKSEFNTATVFITHDLGVVSEIADRVIVMYAGKIVETGDVYSIFQEPLHPYTRGLMSAKIERSLKGSRLPYIKGFVPSSTNVPPGCPFHPRCEYKLEICDKIVPGDTSLDGRTVSCHLFAQPMPTSEVKTDDGT